MQVCISCKCWEKIRLSHLITKVLASIAVYPRLSLLTQGIVIICLLIIIMMNVIIDQVAIAEGVTMNFQWTGKKGYSAEVIFSYDEGLMPNQIIEEGRGKTKIIEDLTVSFYDPAGQLLGIYDNIKQGISQDPYFKFNFDPQQQKITGLIDLGGDSSGEIYLKGIVQENLRLFKIDRSGKEKFYDQNTSFGVQEVS